MHARTILENLDNGTIDQASAADLLAQHADPLYVIGSYLETRKMRDEWRTKCYALQDGRPETPAAPKDIIDLIDHAYATGFITWAGAVLRLEEAGMDPKNSSHHVSTLEVIAMHDMQRAVYLDDPENAPRYCTRCGRQLIASVLSRRGICVECSTAAVEENLIALDTKTGPGYTRWRDAMLKYCYSLESEEITERGEMHPKDRADMPDPFHVASGIPETQRHEPGADLIDHDKYPGCDSECDDCPDLDCPFRNPIFDTG